MSDKYAMVLAFELKNSEIPKFKDLIEHWPRIVDYSEAKTPHQEKTAKRSLGGLAPGENKLVDRVLMGPSGAAVKFYTLGGKRGRLTSRRLYHLKSMNPVVVFELEFEDLNGINPNFRKLKGGDLKKLVDEVGLTECIDSSNSINCIVGTIAPEGDPWTPSAKDGWLHIDGHYIYRIVLRKLVVQATIEKAILNNTLVRRNPEWPVEFFFDLKNNVPESYRSFHESLNIPDVRKEQLRKSKDRRIVVSAWVAGLTLLATLAWGIVGLFNK